MRRPDSPLALPASRVSAVRRALRAWYRAHGRDLPWRRTRDPYRVLVSELMLQQQTVRHVTPVYLRFLERFPDLPTLAAAPVAGVLRVWQPLGRYNSALRLHATARRLLAERRGRVPRTVEALLALDGVGPYTAGAVVCFAFGSPAPLVDTNVRRVLGRLFAGRVPGGARGAGDDRLAWRLATAVLPARGAYEWNQALLDLGATVCIARTPRCGACPVRRWCDTHREAIAPAPATSGPEQTGVTPARGAAGMVAERRGAYVAGEAPAGSARAPGARFEGSRRWLRGQIMQALCALPDGASLALPAFVQRLGAAAPPPETLDSAVAMLAREGLLRCVPGPDGALRLTLPG